MESGHSMAEEAPLSPRILVVEDDEDALLLLKLILQPYGYEIISAHNTTQALNAARRRHPDLIILEVAIEDGAGFDLCRRLHTMPGGHARPILVLSRLTRSEDIMRGLEAGASVYLTKPADPTELVARIQALLRHSQMMQPTVVLVLGAKAGVGATTLAVNLGVALAHRWQEKVVLLDTEIPGGDPAIHLGLQPSHSLDDLISYGDEVDLDLIEGVICTHASGLQLISGPASIPETLPPPGFLAPILQTMAGYQRYVIIDSPPLFGERLWQTIRLADHVLVVTVPELPALIRAERLLEAAAARGLHAGYQVSLVVNQVGRRGGVPLERLPAAMREYPWFEFPFDPDRVLTAINIGHPLVLHAPHSPFARKVTELAQALRSPLPESAPPGETRAGLRGLLSRLRR